MRAVVSAVVALAGYVLVTWVDVLVLLLWWSMGRGNLTLEHIGELGLAAGEYEAHGGVCLMTLPNCADVMVFRIDVVNLRAMRWWRDRVVCGRECGKRNREAKTYVVSNGDGRS